MNDNRAPIKAWEIIGILLAATILIGLVSLTYLAIEVRP